MATTGSSRTPSGSFLAHPKPEGEPAAPVPALLAEFCEKYSLVRQGLVNYFYRKRALDPHALADRALFILIGKVLQSAPMEAGLEAYAYGVAGKVFLESTREPEFAEIRDSLAEPVKGSIPAAVNAIEAQVLLRQCAAGVPPEEYEIWVRYHHADRHALARDLRITENALRIRVHRISQQMIEAGKKTSRGNFAK